MKNRSLILFLSLILILSLSVPTASAVDGLTVSANIVSAYGMGSRLYTFVQTDGKYDLTQMRAEMLPNHTDSISAPELLTQSDCLVRYLLVVDLSGSMKRYRERVDLFINSLVEHEQKNAVFAVASFGEYFEPITGDLTDPRAITNTLDNLSYTEQLTNPYGGVVNALRYLDSCPRLGGDLVNLVLITDGMPELGYPSKAENEAAEIAAAADAAAALAASPQVVVHTVCVAEWDELAYETFSQGSGLDLILTDGDAAVDAGEQLSGFVDSLYRTDFLTGTDTDSKTFSVQLQFIGKDENDQLLIYQTQELAAVPILRLASANVDPAIPSDPGAEFSLPPEESQPAEESQLPEESQAVEESPSPERDLLPDSSLWIIAAGAAILVLALIVVIILLIRRRKRKNGGSRADENAVFMRLEVISGTYAGKRDAFYLRDELIVGSKSTCDLVWKDAGVASVNTRIFMKDHIICIEDMNSPNGTALNGMKLYAPNRLRSGDEISIGAVCFRLRF